MALIVKTSAPKGLLESIRTAIDKKTIVTWTYDKKGNFIHNTAQWKDAGFLEPVIKDGSLELLIQTAAGKKLDVPTYGMLFSAFVQTLLNHFNDKFETATVTARPLISKPKPTLNEVFKKKGLS